MVPGERSTAAVSATPVDRVITWAREHSLWPLIFGASCCSPEVDAALGPCFDLAQFGVEPLGPGPRQADLLIVAGRISLKMMPVLQRTYEQMPDPTWVIAMGSCATNGGPYYRSYSVVMGVDHLIPVDVYVPGCPPRPEALMFGLMQLQEKISKDAKNRDRAPKA